VDSGGDWWSKGRSPDALASPKQLAWLCVKTPSELTPDDAATLARLRQDKEAARVMELTQRFCEVVRARGSLKQVRRR
jgi:predicted RNA-binding protein with PUA-like domain